MASTNAARRVISAPLFPVTGHRALAPAVHRGDLVHLEPHRVDGRIVPTRPRDVLVEAVRPLDLAHVAVDWLDYPAFPGSSDHRRGRSIYGRCGGITVIGHVDLGGAA